MHKKENLGKLLAREQSKTGWVWEFKQERNNAFGELSQTHISKGIGFHFPRSMGSHNRIWNRGRG